MGILIRRIKCGESHHNTIGVTPTPVSGMRVFIGYPYAVCGNVTVNASTVWVAVLTIEVEDRFNSDPDVATPPSIRFTDSVESSASPSVTAASNRNHPAVPVATATPDHVFVASLMSTPAAESPQRSALTAVTPPVTATGVPNVIVVPVPANTPVFNEAPIPGRQVNVITPEAPVVVASK